MSDRWMMEAREMAISLGRDYPDVVERIAKKLSAAHEAGRREALDALLADDEANDAARHIMMWMDMGDRPTEAKLLYLCNRFGHPLPEGCRDVDHVPPKATRSFWILKTIVEAHRAAIRNQYREAVDSINRATDAEIEAAVAEKERRDDQMTVADIRKRKAAEREFQDAIRSREVKS